MPSRLLTNLAAAGVMAVTKPLTAAGVIRRHDPWRRATGIGLKSEGSKFTLTAFGLDLWSDVQRPPANASYADCRQHFLERFDAFIRNEACTHVQVHERRGCCAAVPVDRPRTRPGEHEPPDGASVCAVWFEGVGEGLGRFEPPDCLARVTNGPELVHVTCRITRDGASADVWAQLHHAAVDGAPMQELLDHLRTAWGTKHLVTFPTPDEWRARAEPRPWSRPGDRGLEHVLDFQDFRALLERRGASGHEKPTVAALLIWRLAQQSGFEGKRFAATVDVPATGDEPRCVDFVVIRPADFGPSRFPDYVATFNRMVEACRARRSPIRAAAKSLALLPPRLALAALRANPRQTAQTFGTVGVTILRNAETFLAPMSDPGFDDGFIAIGSMALLTQSEGRVAAVSVKAPAGKALPLLDALRGAIK